MERLDLAIRRYQQLVPTAANPVDLSLRRIRVWLAEEVSPVLEDFTGRPTFRDYASWPVVALRAGAATHERQLIDQVDVALVESGRALVELVESKLAQKRLRELFPPSTIAVSGKIEMADSSGEQVAMRRKPVDSLRMRLAQLRAVAHRDWFDLVNVNDYFEPQQEWIGSKTDRIQRADWIVALNPELLPIGNFVVRCLLKRIQLIYQLLQGMRHDCCQALKSTRHNSNRKYSAVEASWSELEQLVNLAETQLRTGEEQRLRDSCVVATQVYAAFHPAPDLAWLGLDDNLIEQGRMSLKARLNQGQNAQMLDRLASALGDLKIVGRGMPADRRPIEEAVSSGGLVIVETNREVFWARKPITEPLHEVQWRLLLAIARKAQRRGAAGISDVFANPTSNSAISTAWGRLKCKLPATLHRLVAPGEVPRTYRLDLEPHRIHIFS